MLANNASAASGEVAPSTSCWPHMLTSWPFKAEYINLGECATILSRSHPANSTSDVVPSGEKCIVTKAVANSFPTRV